jgi:hypothetical protein
VAGWSRIDHGSHSVIFGLEDQGLTLITGKEWLEFARLEGFLCTHDLERMPAEVRSIVWVAPGMVEGIIIWVDRMNRAPQIMVFFFTHEWLPHSIGLIRKGEFIN